MVEINFFCSLLCFPTHFVLCIYLICFSPTSVNGSEKKTNPGCLPCIFLGHNLSNGSTSPGNIPFQAFYFAETSSQWFVFNECLWASLSCHESFPPAMDKDTADGFVFTIDSSVLFYYDSCSCCGMFNLSIV